MTVLRNEGRWDRSNASFRHGRVELYDKRTLNPDMSYIDYGLSVFRREVVAEIPQAEKCDLADLLHTLSVQGRLAGYEVQARFYEVGSPAGLADLEAMLEARRPAVFLDRDGVLVQALVHDGKPFSARDADDFEIVPGAADACAALRTAGLLIVVVTNQPDVARGDLSIEALSAMHEALLDRIPVDAVLFCPHDDGDSCPCRKPAPGLLFKAARRFGISLPQSVMVGDRWKDIEAGARAGCRTVFIDAGYDERRPDRQDLTVTCLTEALPWILTTTGVADGAT
jgi:D-glycero-D-manno-heptose 1,7-bisphosphate phosphatase